MCVCVRERKREREREREREKRREGNEESGADAVNKMEGWLWSGGGGERRWEDLM